MPFKTGGCRMIAAALFPDAPATLESRAAALENRRRR